MHALKNTCFGEKQSFEKKESEGHCIAITLHHLKEEGKSISDANAS